MSKMKKVVALILTVVMVMAMGMTAFAADEANIVISNPGDGHFAYVQVIEPDQKEVTGWDFTNDTIANAYKKAFGVTDNQRAIAMLILAKDPNATLPKSITDAGTVTAATTAQIAKALSTVRDSVKFNPIRAKYDANGNLIAPVDKAGVYAVMGYEDGYTYNMMAGYVGFGEVRHEDGTIEYPVLVDAPITAKKVPTGVEKDATDKDDIVSIGDIVTYTIKVFVPYIDANDTDKTFFVYDEITGAEYLPLEGNNVSITMGGNAVSGVEFVQDGNKFSIDLSSLIDDANSNAGKEVVITYKAKVTAVTVDNKANAGHEGGSDFGSDNSKLYTGSIMLTKFNEDESEKLAGAGFEVTKDGEETPLKFTQLTEGHYVLDPNGTITEVFTGPDGTLVIKGLDVGNYHFEETTAPEGYSINEAGADAEISIEKDENTETKIIEVSTSLKDTKLSELPGTGGIGTTIFTIGGCLIMIAAAALFFASRKKTQK